MMMKKMTMKLQTIKGEVPAGYKVIATIPEDLDADMVRLAFIAILGGIAGIEKSNDAEIKRTFFIRFIASIIGEANAAIHSAQMANRLGQKDPKKIIDDLLKSLHKE